MSDDDDPIFTVTGCLTSWSVVMCSRTTSDNWHFGKISVWEAEQSLAGEHQPAIFSWSTESDSTQNTVQTDISQGKGSYDCWLAGWSYLSQILIVITTHKVILSYPPNSYIYRRAAPDLKLNKRSIMVSDSWWDQVVVVRVMLGWLSLFSLTVVTCVSVSSLPILKLPENGDNGAVMVFSPAQSARSLQRCFQ